LERLVIGISKDLIVQASGNPDDVIMRTLEVIAIRQAPTAAMFSCSAPMARQWI
jgi:hypothetical protein